MTSMPQQIQKPSRLDSPLFGTALLACLHRTALNPTANVPKHSGFDRWTVARQRAFRCASELTNTTHQLVRTRKCSLARLVAILALAIPSVLTAQQEPRRVLIVFGHDFKAPGVVAFVDPFRSVVREGMPEGVEFYEESLDFDRFPDRSRWPVQAQNMGEKYRGMRFDAIVPEGAMALRFVVDHLRSRFPDVPIVYGLVFEPVIDFSALPDGVTGTRLEVPYAATFEMARRLQPDAERLVIVSGSAAMDSALLAKALRDVRPLAGRLEVRVLEDWTYESLLLSLRELPSRTIVLMSSIRQDARGQKFTTGDLMASITSVTPVPVYGVVRNWLGGGIVSGSVMEFGNSGAKTGRLLLRVLRRSHDAALPPAEVEDGKLVADWRQLERWGLSERDLPTGTEVLYRPVTVWQRYYSAILIVLGVLAAQSLLITLLLMERARRRRAQATLKEQVAYEQMVAELTVGTARFSPAEIQDVFVGALACVSRYASADAAILSVAGNGRTLPQERFVWQRSGFASVNGHSDLTLPLSADGQTVGKLELMRNPAIEWSQDVVARLRSAAELVAGAVARAHDVFALEESRSQVTHMARVATVGEFTAAVSHELKQPLSAIRANAETGVRVLAQSSPDVNLARTIFQDIVENNVRAAQVIDHLRVLFRKDEPTVATVDVNDVCRQAVHLAEGEAAFRGVELRLSLDEVPAIRGDTVQLQQALLNLILNALDATAAAARRHVVVATAFRAQAVEISVSDTGPGLPPDVQQHLFEPFFSTKVHGLGMGLTIVRSVVERHHGEVHADSNPSGGARFTLRLPAK